MFKRLTDKCAGMSTLSLLLLLGALSIYAVGYVARNMIMERNCNNDKFACKSNG